MAEGSQEPVRGTSGTRYSFINLQALRASWYAQQMVWRVPLHVLRPSFRSFLDSTQEGA